MSNLLWRWGLIALVAYVAYSLLGGMHTAVLAMLRHQFAWMLP